MPQQQLFAQQRQEVPSSASTSLRTRNGFRDHILERSTKPPVDRLDHVRGRLGVRKPQPADSSSSGGGAGGGSGDVGVEGEPVQRLIWSACERVLKPFPGRSAQASTPTGDRRPSVSSAALAGGGRPGPSTGGRVRAVSARSPCSPSGTQLVDRRLQSTGSIPVDEGSSDALFQERSEASLALGRLRQQIASSTTETREVLGQGRRRRAMRIRG